MKWWVCFSLPLLSAFLACAPCPLSCQETPAGTTGATVANAVAKPTRKPDQVVTNDPIALLAMRGPTARTIPAAGPQDSSSSSANETARQTVEIASVEQQIKDKQKRIVFLMRLFVEDERGFVNDPANTNVDPAAVERRRYEQDELHWETAELARLKAQLRELTASR